MAFARLTRHGSCGCLDAPAIRGLVAAAILCVTCSCHQGQVEVKQDFPARSAKRYEGLVSVHWVKKLVDYAASPHSQPRPMSYENQQFVIVEASWNPLEKATEYLNGHIPGSIHLNTDDLETGYPEWKLLEPRALQSVFGHNGISPQTTVVVYGDKLIAAARVWWIMKYAGVEDVRLMDGDMRTWRRAGYPTEARINQRAPVEFSAPVLSDWIATTTFVQLAIRSTSVSLADVRSEAEYAGRASGYKHLDARGRIPGAQYLGDADDSSALYRRPDGHLHSPTEVLEHWRTSGLHLDRTGQRFQQEVIFYCGGGWRSSVAFFYAWLMGIDNVRNYSDGWCGWSTRYQRDPAAGGSTPGWQQLPTGNPIEIGP